jgi:hypothetical protein
MSTRDPEARLDSVRTHLYTALSELQDFRTEDDVKLRQLLTDLLRQLERIRRRQAMERVNGALTP